ncbi:MAG: riboflavin synthase [Vicingaceae bacterium]|nr:riboflavin synthase [Vicingaceae bacterium]
MFTGIIEALGKVEKIEKEGSNVHFTIKSDLAAELKVDQSLAHNGVCLTVVDVMPTQYKVTAINETLQKSNLGYLKIGSIVNLERAMPANGRFDGHVVQGHVDGTAICVNKVDENGSWMFTFKYENNQHITVEKGSITVNGVSLTVVSAMQNQFSVCIIPYTFENTSFKEIQIGSIVNLEFDIIGKYVERLLAYRK